MSRKSPIQKEPIRGQRRVASDRVSRGQKRALESPRGNPSYQKHFRFRFDRVDIGAQWCLSEITAQDHRDLLTVLAEIESMRVGEIIPSRCRHEDVAGASPNPDAQKRAREQYLDDHDRIHSLKISGKRRLWGIMNEHEFSIIWWDPEHEVWPTRRVYGN